MRFPMFRIEISLHRILRSILIATLLILCTSFLRSDSAYAYVLYGFKWPGQPAPGVCCAHISYAKTSGQYLWDSQGWDDGVSAWNASPALVIFNQAGSANLTLAEANYSNVSWDGLSNINAMGTSISYATSWLNAFYTQPYNATRSQVQSIAAHELGHDLGLDHNSVGCQLMLRYTSDRWKVWGGCKVNTPQQDDINGVNSLY